MISGIHIYTLESVPPNVYSKTNGTVFIIYSNIFLTSVGKC